MKKILFIILISLSVSVHAQEEKEIKNSISEKQMNEFVNALEILSKIGDRFFEVRTAISKLESLALDKEGDAVKEYEQKIADGEEIYRDLEKILKEAIIIVIKYENYEGFKYKPSPILEINAGDRLPQKI